MKQKKYSKQLKNSNKKNESKCKIFMYPNKNRKVNLNESKYKISIHSKKYWGCILNERRICNNLGILAKRVSFGRKNDANSTSYRKGESNAFGIGSSKRRNPGNRISVRSGAVACTVEP